jgi:hypothetical protein
MVSDIVDRLKAGQGSLPGSDYQTIRSRLSRMAQNARQSDPEFSSAIRGLRDAVDSNMGRSISPSDQATAQNKLPRHEHTVSREPHAQLKI